MLISLALDVEDLVTVESDEAALWIAQMMREEGLTASFFVVGEKARLWEARGRQDVIEAFKHHDISFHSTWHSVHPTTAEICQDRDFLEGIQALWEWEKKGWEDAERIFGRPLSGWGRTGSSWGPSISGLMGKKGRAYMYTPIRLEGWEACWFTGCLQFACQVGGFDDALADDTAFEARLKETLTFLGREANGGRGWLGVFIGHPTKLISLDFWDAVNFREGANPPRDQWKRPPLKPEESLPIIKKNFRRLLQAISRRPHLRCVGFSELSRAFDGQKPFLTHEAMMEACRRISREERVLFTDDFTAGEILCALCQAAEIPSEHYPRRFTFGPNSLPPVSPVTAFDAASVVSSAGEVLRSVSETGCLPPSIPVQGQNIGLGTYFIALAKSLLSEERITAPAEMPYPPEAEEVARRVNQEVPGWIIHPRDLKMDTILLHTRLQCWTLKPARMREF